MGYELTSFAFCSKETTLDVTCILIDRGQEYLSIIHFGRTYKIELKGYTVNLTPPIDGDTSELEFEEGKIAIEFYTMWMTQPSDEWLGKSEGFEKEFNELAPEQLRKLFEVPFKLKEEEGEEEEEEEEDTDENWKVNIQPQSSTCSIL